MPSYRIVAPNLRGNMAVFETDHFLQAMREWVALSIMGADKNAYITAVHDDGEWEEIYWGDPADIITKRNVNDDD